MPLKKALPIHGHTLHKILSERLDFWCFFEGAAIWDLQLNTSAEVELLWLVIKEDNLMTVDLTPLQG